MSYYPPHHPGTGSSYPYSTYHPPTPGAYSATPGAYPTTPYQSTYPPTAVTGYGGTWPYAYSYYPPQQSTQTALNVAKPTIGPATPVTTAAMPTPAPQRSAPTPASYTFTPTYTRESVFAASTGGAVSRGARKQSTMKGLFTKELRNLMYGFGDDRNPANDTVNVMEEILIEYIVDVCQTALTPGKKSRLSIEDLRRALSRPADAKKLARMEELLFMQEDIKRARAQFEESDMNQASSFQS
ncbi:transcription initiation factor IID, 18kD subunit-domain-containing protein [Sparassis latifolia]|uniref:Transcription initiation factor TFIID subunit 13 n=1 Tax=Sparassis crispa TaxID=139825 RepID=A0A401GIF5_9APHY|nr:Transcription initiation factor TFIID subunit 13 [Sparassis crispa]GBE81966.1 Transcription initiation factor TFIID subunit 13 [Sparassis crispa]